ncbi:MAG TPA: alanine racemase [Kribbellaceae bacterium]|nr:alanine racemase [Kribbellaceae bacterium]
MSTSQETRRPRAEAVVDLAAIRHNVRTLRAHVGPAEVMVVVKADGYGHGILPSARAARAAGASWLGVAVVEEALALRAAGDTGPILCWLAVPGERLADAVAADIDLSASAVWMVDELVTAAGIAGRPVRVHLKVDTGLNRSGATAADWTDLVTAAAKARAAGHLEIIGVWSHLACSDEPGHPANAAQVAAFADALEVAARHGVQPPLRHLANSGGTLALPDTWYDLVRPGIASYGLSPFGPARPSAELGLRPAMTLRAGLAVVKRVGAGEGVSYGHTYVTSQPTTLGLVPLGYGDGIPRHASGRGPVLAAGKRRTIAGRVCMDQFVLDLDGDDAAAGDDVVLFGPGDGGEPTADDWAVAAETINYEIVTRIGPRVPRCYTGGDPRHDPRHDPRPDTGEVTG